MTTVPSPTIILLPFRVDTTASRAVNPEVCDRRMHRPTPSVLGAVLLTGAGGVGEDGIASKILRQKVSGICSISGRVSNYKQYVDSSCEKVVLFREHFINIERNNDIIQNTCF